MLTAASRGRSAGSTSSASATSSWPATASSTLCRRSRSRPSRSSTRSARGADSQAVGSSVPVSSKASGKPSASPHEATSGRRSGASAPARVQDRGPARRAAPLVQVADEEVGAEPVQVDGEHARRVRAVDEHREPALLQRGHQRHQRQPPGGRRGDVVEDARAGSGRARPRGRARPPRPSSASSGTCTVSTRAPRSAAKRWAAMRTAP